MSACGCNRLVFKWLHRVLVYLIFSHRCGIFSRRRSRGCNIYTQPDPSAKCETALFQSRLLFPGAAIFGHTATSLGSSSLGGRTLPGQSQGILFLHASSPSKNNSRIMPEYGRWCQVFTFQFFVCFFSSSIVSVTVILLYIIYLDI